MIDRLFFLLAAAAAACVAVLCAAFWPMLAVGCLITLLDAAFSDGQVDVVLVRIALLILVSFGGAISGWACLGLWHRRDFVLNPKP